MEISYSQLRSTVPGTRTATSPKIRYQIDDTEKTKEVFNRKTQANRQSTLAPVTQGPTQYLESPEQRLLAIPSLALTYSRRAGNETPANYQSNKAIKIYSDIDQQKNGSIEGDLISRIDRFI